MKSRIKILSILLIATVFSGCKSNNEKAADLMAQGEAAMTRGDLPFALFSFRQATMLRDDNPQYWVQRARAEAAGGDYGNAYDAYLRAHELDGGNADIIANLAEITLLARRYDQAVRYADNLLALDSRNLRAVTIKGFAALGRKRYDQALAIANEILARAPNDPVASMLKARVLIAQGQPLAAIALLSPLVNTPNANSLRATLVEAYRMVGKGAAAEQLSARLAQENPADSEAQFDYARQLYLAGNPTQASAVLKRIKHDPGNTAYAGRLLGLWADVGRRTSPQGEATRAGDDATPAQRMAIARYALFAGQPNIAVAQLKKVAPAGGPTPTTVEIFGLMAYAQDAAGAHAEAQALANQVLAIDAENPGALLTRAQQFLAKGDLDDALRDTRRVVRDDPSRPEARMLLAAIYQKRKQPEAARQTFAEGLKADPGNVIMLARYTHQLAADGRSDLAARATGDYVKAYGQSLAGWEWYRYACRAAKDEACLATADAAIARLNGTQILTADPPVTANPAYGTVSGSPGSGNAAATSVGALQVDAARAPAAAAPDDPLVTGAEAVLNRGAKPAPRSGS